MPKSILSLLAPLLAVVLIGCSSGSGPPESDAAEPGPSRDEYAMYAALLDTLERAAFTEPKRLRVAAHTFADDCADAADFDEGFYCEMSGYADELRARWTDHARVVLQANDFGGRTPVVDDGFPHGRWHTFGEEADSSGFGTGELGVVVLSRVGFSASGDTASVAYSTAHLWACEPWIGLARGVRAGSDWQIEELDADWFRR